MESVWWLVLAFFCGAAFVCGGMFALLVFLLLRPWKHMAKQNDGSLALLNERNEIGRAQVLALEKIAEAATQFAETR